MPDVSPYNRSLNILNNSARGTQTVISNERRFVDLKDNFMKFGKEVPLGLNCLGQKDFPLAAHIKDDFKEF